MTRMERTLLNEIYAQWKSAKQRAQQECENRALFNMAEKYRACTMFKGTEDLEQIIRLFTSPQGVEFCQKYHFPDITTLRRFKQYDVERYGIYIDAGHIRLENDRTVVLIGKTSACLSYDSKGRHEVILMHGAQASIQASAWAVVFVSGEHGCQVIKKATDRAMIL